MPPKKTKITKNNDNINADDETEADEEIPRKKLQKFPNISVPENRVKILKGFYMEKCSNPISLSISNCFKQELSMEVFSDQLLPISHSILHFSSESNSTDSGPFTQLHIKLVQGLAKTKLIQDINEQLKTEIQHFAETLPGLMETFCETVTDIRSFWNETSTKINQFSLLFSPIANHFQPIHELFLEFCGASFFKNMSIYNKEIDLFLSEYNQCKENNNMLQISKCVNFPKGSGLFSTCFIPRFLESVYSDIEPIINQSFETRPFDEYLKIALEIYHKEMEMAAIFEDGSILQQLKDKINELIYSSKVNGIFHHGLRELLEDNEIDSIWECSKLARLTNLFPDFIQEMSLLFEAEAAACFALNKSSEQKHRDDPISKIMKLYRNLSLFCEKACGPESKKSIKLSFERGFNSQNELTAKLLAISIHRFFSKKQKGEFNEYETIDEYVDLFKMLGLNDVFETYYTQFLARRLLAMKNQMFKPESYFIDQLTRQCGAEYTRRMQDLLDDRSKSQEITSSFITECKKDRNSHINFDVFRFLMVSSQNAGSWTELKSIQIALPPMISELITRFTDYFRSTKEGKSLDWNLHLSTATLQVKNVIGLKKIKCSGEVAIILLSFNESARNERLKQLQNQLEIIRNEKLEKERLEKKKKAKSKSKKTPTKPQRKNNKKARLRKDDSDDNESESLDESESIHEESTSEEEIPIKTRRGMKTRQKETKKASKRKQSNKNQLFEYSDKDESSELEDSADEEIPSQKNADDSLAIEEEQICKEIDDLEHLLSKPYDGSLTIEELILLTEGQEEDLSVRISILKSKKGHKLILKEHIKQVSSEEPSKVEMIPKYRINPNCEVPDSVLSLPFVLPQLTEAEEKRTKTAIIDNRDSQFDAAIVSILKADRSIDEDALFNKMASKLNFKIAREYFDQRLRILEKKEYLKIDPSGKIHYITT